MNPFLPTEKRNNFYQFPLIVGHKNTSHRNTNEIAEVEDHDDDDDNMNEFMSLFSIMVNSSAAVNAYFTTGTKNSEGEWTDLIGAVTKEEIDIAVDTIIHTIEKSDDMSFTYNILKFVPRI
ncbi:hypothetical protein NQ317_008029 [Molorchus minor]|uniref:Uncharacterized protein n=1 Tax=Molorchus minor TaxID=1323400 RepID=A0ABQ9JK82_9CUCU|nr:hypothetical protein NQ317_008029 [Molorchus minor]